VLQKRGKFYPVSLHGREHRNPKEKISSGYNAPNPLLGEK